MEFPQFITPCPEGVMELTYTVEASQTDAYGRMRTSDLARQMEKITEMHLSSFGIDYLSLREEGKAWVISWTSSYINKLPAEGDNVILRMWPSKNKAVMYNRNYGFYTEQGEPLACAASLFVMMDLNTRSVAMPSSKVKAIPVISIPGEAKPPKMREVMPAELTKQVTRTVQPTEIDKNGHMNNTCYLDWADDIRKAEGVDEKTPTYVWVQYIQELREGQKATLSYETMENSLYMHGKGKADSFLIKMNY